MKGMSRKCKIAVVAALAAYIVKNLFVGADWDEGYGIVMGYRLAMGDRLLLEMWEPHQTSAIFTSLFIQLFIQLTGGVEFLNIYLRVVYFLIHGAVTYFVYSTFRTCILHGEKQKALWLALVYFTVSPKCIFIPEYSNLHIWFFTLLCLSILWYICAGSPLHRRWWLPAAAGLALACDVLAYPSMVILFPVFLVIIWHKNSRRTDCLLFAAPCFLLAAVFGGYLLSYMPFHQILQMIPHILSDGSHRTGFFEKIMDWIKSFGEIALILIAACMAAGALTLMLRRFSRKKRDIAVCFLGLVFLLLAVYQFYCWFTSKYAAFYPLVIYCFILLGGLYGYHRDRRKEKEGLYLILISLLGYFGVLLLSNWGPIYLMPYLIVGVLGGLVYLGGFFGDRISVWKEKVIPVLCGILIFSNVFGYCWLYIGGEYNHSSILTLGGINREGLRKGILTSYMSAYRYNEDHKVWLEAVPEGSTCLYIGPGQYYYMFGDCRIAAPSTISTPVYDENLLVYWELNPDRYPDVVIVESWYGDMRAAGEGSYIRQWLENDFQASEVTDYSYFTVYKK